MKINPDFQEEDLFVSLFKENIFCVGGYVRDLIRENPSKDIDILVINTPLEEIEKKLSIHGKVDIVGKSFGVIKFTREGRTYDVSLPRSDIPVESEKRKHKDFIIKADPYLPIEKDLERRDITCNSIALRLIDGKIIDPFGGVKDIKEKRIRMTNPSSFPEDPLRVIRVARFASILGWKIEKSIYEISKKIDLTGLSAERITEELFKMILNSKKPSRGFEEFLKLRVIEQLFPEIFPMTFTIQDSYFHPEKDRFGNHTVWIHTLLTIDQAKRITEIFKLSPEKNITLILAALFHDIAKPHTSRWEFKNMRLHITNYRHDILGVEISEKILDRLKIFTWNNFDIRKYTLLLIKHHHRSTDLWQNRRSVTKKAFNRLYKDMENEIELLIYLDLADRKGREKSLLKGLDREAKWLFSKIEELGVNKETIKPIIHGRDLLKLGFSPGEIMGKILKQLYELQLDGVFSTKEEGISLALEISKKLTEEKN
ncbi:MAG: HD domain-containing protein [Candidatus Aminicenantia bacterium]